MCKYSCAVIAFSLLAFVAGCGKEEKPDSKGLDEKDVEIVWSSQMDKTTPTISPTNTNITVAPEAGVQK